MSKGRRTECPSSWRESENVSFHLLLVLFRISTNWMVPTHIGEGRSFLLNLLSPTWWEKKAKVCMLNIRSTHSLLLGMQDGTATWKGIWAFSYETKHSLVIQSSNHITKHLPNSSENWCPHQNLNVKVHVSFTHNHPKLEQPCMFINTWLDKHDTLIVNTKQKCICQNPFTCTAWGINFNIYKF